MRQLLGDTDFRQFRLKHVGLPLFDNLSAIRFISYSGTVDSELFGCNWIIRSCSAAIVQIHLRAIFVVYWCC